jgi:hypothetical protein
LPTRSVYRTLRAVNSCLLFAIDLFVAGHEGLAFLAPIGFEWPSIEAVQGFGGVGGLSERLNATHVLRSRFGYGVAAGTVAEERRKKLSRAITGPGCLGAASGRRAHRLSD